MTFKRNAEAVKAVLVQKDGKVYCKEPCRIQIPVRFVKRNMAKIGTSNFIYGLFPIILESGEYALHNLCAMVEILPYKTTETTVDGEDYYEFHFEKNSVVINNTTVVQRKTLMFNVFDELFFKGKIPWYLNYFDICSLFDTAKSHADSKVAEVPDTIELLASIISRSVENPKLSIRLTAKSINDFKPSQMKSVALKNVMFSVNTTLNKLAGSYFDPGVRSALVQPTDQVDKLESILRA